MRDLVAAVPAIILITLGLVSLGLGVHWMMITEPPAGQLGIVAALAGYFVAWGIAFKFFTT